MCPPRAVMRLPVGVNEPVLGSKTSALFVKLQQLLVFWLL